MGSYIKCLILIFVVKVCISIKVNNGGYEDIYIFIREGVEENDNLIRRIKEVFTEASSFMLPATENRLYFKNIRIVVPKSWSKKPEYLNIPAPSLSREYIIVDKIIDRMTTPHVPTTGVCGAGGTYMFLSSTDFILNDGYTRWGSHDHVIVHEWGHLRWGVFDEYPISTKFYQGGGKWIPVRCTTQIKGKIGIGRRCSSNDNECDITNTGKKMSSRCNFCPIEPKDNSASLMGYSFFNSIKRFCDKDDSSVNSEQRHNRQAPNRHNIVCKYKSVWEVMRKHIDFKDNIILPPNTNTVPNFEIIQSSKEIRRVFVLDVSGSMKGDKLTILQQTCRYVLQDVIPQGSWLGIVTFSSSASTRRHVTQINSQADRDALISALPSVASGGTCIRCGIEQAIRILKINLQNAENTEILLISDGLDSGNIQASIQKAVSEKVIVNTIAVSQEADSILPDIAQDTGGKHYTYLEKGTISLAATFSELIKDDHTMSASRQETLVSEKIDSTNSTTLKFDFAIEESIGANTTITVISRSYQELHLEVSGPNGFTQALFMNGTQVTMLINGIAQAGLYLLTISMSNPNQTVEYYVSSTPTKPDVIKISTQLSASKIDVSSGDVPVAFATVTKGYSQVINASVKAHVEADKKRCTLSLLDNGHDPDAFADDGVYSGYVFPRCLDSGRVNIKVYASGQKGLTRISRKVIGAPSLIEEDVDEPEPFDESFQRVQVMEELYITKDINDEDNADVVAPGRITDVGIYHIVKETSMYGENRNFTISWTATGDDRNQGHASSYIMRVSDDFDALLNNFDSAAILNMTNTRLIPQEAGQTEAIKLVVDAEKSYIETTFFAIQAVDEAGNPGAVSNIVSIVVAKGYRLKAEPGTLNIESNEIADNDNIAGIIRGTVGATICLVIICVMIVLLRKHLR